MNRIAYFGDERLYHTRIGYEKPKIHFLYYEGKPDAH